jgi:hypothetical protein
MLFSSRALAEAASFGLFVSRAYSLLTSVGPRAVSASP